MNYFRFFLMSLLVVSLSLSGCGRSRSDLNVKNIILLIADGCGYNQVNAANLYRYGKTGTTAYENFPVVCAVSTYSASSIGYDPEKMWASFAYALKKPTDSAAAATSLACGIKTYNGILGMDTTYTVVENISERAEELGKSSGVITTVPFNHATPAGFAAHDSSRGHYAAIGNQMIMGKMEVIMGCGHPEYDDNGQSIPEPDYSRWGGPEKWQALKDGKTGKDADGDGIDDPWTFLDARSDFMKLMNGETPKRVFGLARAASTLQQSRTNGDPKAPPFAVPFNQDVPNLAEMTRGALNVLDNDPDGFFLMIEGGAIDWAGHDNQSGRIIEEKIDFDDAIGAVTAWVETNSSWEETLVMITGDHETGYLLGPGSGNDSLLAEGGINAVWVPLVNNGKGKEPGMEWHSGGHTNQLIPFYAKGAGCEIFDKYADQSDPVRGRYIDNTEIAKAMFKLWRKK
jgi:alkaline phosphatase